MTEKFIKDLCFYVEKHGYQKMCKDLNIQPSQIKKYMDGNCYPRLDTAERIISYIKQS